MAHRILLVEDQAVLRTLAARALRFEEYEVVEASEGLQAWALAKASRFDLLITDSQMPRLGGSEFVARVRELHPRCPSCESVAVMPPVLRSSGYELCSSLSRSIN
jgi:two-component system OmpR family response regulator